jgi:hypothetical protein
VRIPSAFWSSVFSWTQLRGPVDLFHDDSDGYDEDDWR